tara:strand:- start:1249 stop:1380 length:132 start_codon:yes stop_codon:yes gene_type:complete
MIGLIIYLHHVVSVAKINLNLHLARSGSKVIISGKIIEKQNLG